MGDHECWAQPSGILPSEAGTVTRPLDRERWAIAEERTAKLIADIQPNPLAEERRSAVADYVQRVIQKCLDCEVFTFGSVPLKTYLPDGDIDLSAFSKHQNLKDTWANEVRDVLENEEKSENAEFRVKEVQYIQAEVKLIKCLVENIVVDISFNQLGGLCTLCFLEEVDKFIGHNHLFKRSIILVKAWCYYESRILGAHHGLISTYALETLVLYIFHVFNNSFSGPLEVLYRFLAFFSNFDWESYCVNLRGPIPLQSLPDMTAEPPRKDGGKLLFDKPYLDKCSTLYAVSPGGQTFISKYFNVVDPLRTTNNLGRSVSKGNFYRIRSAFGFGAKKLAKILECPRDKIVYEIDQFFMNTRERHGSGQRPDAPIHDIRQPYQQSSPNNLNHVEASSSTCSWKDSEDNSGNSIAQGQRSCLLSRTHDDAGKSVQGSRGISTGLLGNPSERRNMRGSMNQEPLSGRVGVSSTFTSRSNNKSAGNRGHQHQASVVVSEQSLNESGSSTRNQKGSKTDLSCADLDENVVSHFVRAFSSPELTNVTNENTLRGRKFRGEGGEAAKNQVASSSSRTSQNSTEKRRRNMGSDSTASHASKNAVSNDSFVSKQNTSHDNTDTDKGRSFSNYSSAVTSVTENHDGGHGLRRETEQTEDMSETTLSTAQDEQDQANNFMGMGQPHYLNRQNPQIHFPVNLSNLQLPVSIAPSLIAPMYAPTNLPGMVRTSVPLVDSGWGLPGQSASYTAMRFPQGAIPPMPPCIPSSGLAGHSRSEDANAPEKVEASQQQEDGESRYESNSWHQIDERDALPGPSVGSDIKVTRSYHAVHNEAESSNNDNPSSSSSGFNSFVKAQKKLPKDGRGQFPEERISNASQFSSGRFDDTGVESSSKGVSSSFVSGSSKAVENNWTGATVRAPKSSRDKRGKGRGNGSNDFSSLKSRETSSSSHMKTNSGWQPGSNFITGDEMVNQDAHSSGAFSLESTTHDDHQASFEHASKSSESSSVASYTQSKNMGPVFTAAPRIQPSNVPAYEPGTVMPSDSVGNMSPVLMGQGLKQRSMDNPGVPFAFYPTGPLVPLYMFPLSYIPTDGNPSGDLSNSFDNMSSPDDNIDGRIDHSDQGMDNSGYDMGECSENSETYGGLNMGTEASIMDNGDEMNPDILRSDFNSHWLNLQYGRFCQNPCISTPLFCPPSAAIPPMYLQGHIPWEGPGRPLSTNMGMLTPFVSYGHRFVPVIPLQQPNSNRPTHNFHRFNGPNRLYSRGGTGTYLPIPKQGPYKDRQSSGNKNNRNSYNHDRSDHGDRDAGWPSYPKGKGAGRGQSRYDNRNQTERSNSRVDRLSEMKGGERYWDSYRNDNIRRNFSQAYHGSYSSANPPVSAGNVGAHGASGMSYGMYPLQTMNAFGNVSPMPGNGLVMLYPYDHNMGFTQEPLEFGSLGPVQIPGSQEGRLTDGSSDTGPRFNEGHFYENHKPGSYSANTSPGGSPTDQPSSPQHHQRSSTQRSYQLKDEDFPPLSFRNQPGRGRSNSFNMGNHSSNSGSHYQSFLVSPS